MSTTPLIRDGDPSVPAVVQRRSVLNPERAFAIIAPIDLSLVFRGWGPFPGVRGVSNQSGSWDAVGDHRNPDLTDGSTANERLTEYVAPHSFAYELTDFTNLLRHFVAGVRGEWTFAPDGGGTLIRWTYEFKPLPWRRAIVGGALAPLWRRYMEQALRDAVSAAERIANSE
ncbi:hypothetical protein BWI15_13720 [Kribbella sp. ALI-6-A]|uniref:SRPBCC family protein n=1 Tax=Kribbella sp. ALI-6-A TaxID=1933817 RepID=UPI00097C1645|nr:SRPBCC family protein [Kribbella sp. ALI-6-A]ONI74368.1 hypothetical protein BWI15_13720 [Kribbella sp. ALI-6-A]